MTSKRKPFDTIIFTINSTRTQEDDETNNISEDEKALKVQASLSPLLAEPYKSRLFQICETWKRHGDIGFAYSKVVYYEKQYKKGLMSHQKMKNFLIKALEEETKIQLHSTKKKSVSRTFGTRTIDEYHKLEGTDNCYYLEYSEKQSRMEKI